jgi:hypothetical protein
MLSKILDLVKQVYRDYPAMVNSALAAAVVFVAAKLGVVVDKQSAVASIAYALPIVLLGGVKTHRKVTPVA